jgi:hypothetical protein
LYKDIDDLVAILVASEETDKSGVIVIVYNIDENLIRRVNLKANHLWGGPGSLGCEIGTG